MQTEIEAKFLDIDHSALRTRLQELRATCTHPMRLMRRKNYDFPDLSLEAKAGWVRVRDEGDKVTLSYKQLQDRTLHGTKEVCLTIDSFEQADVFLREVGLVEISAQETKRESWLLGDVEIDLDEWPWAKPFCEVEAPSQAALEEAVNRLSLDLSTAVHGSVEIAYQAEYDVTDADIDHLPVIAFEAPLPEILATNRRNA